MKLLSFFPQRRKRCGLPAKISCHFKVQLLGKFTETFLHLFFLFVWKTMICAQGQRVLRSGKEKYHSGRCWGKVFSVNELGEGIFLCIRHYDKLRESNETTCCFPQSSASDTCSGRMTKCPQRLITVFESLVDTDKLFLNPNICNKHLIQADTEERIVCSKHYISPRKVSLSTWA